MSAISLAVAARRCFSQCRKQPVPAFLVLPPHFVIPNTRVMERHLRLVSPCGSIVTVTTDSAPLVPSDIHVCSIRRGRSIRINRPKCGQIRSSYFTAIAHETRQRLSSTVMRAVGFLGNLDAARPGVSNDVPLRYSRDNEPIASFPVSLALPTTPISNSTTRQRPSSKSIGSRFAQSDSGVSNGSTSPNARTGQFTH